jgi:fimbrial isopeptide formation D2 family protein
MKKIYTLFVGLTFALLSMQTKAQTTINIDFAGVDTIRTSFCLPDDTLSFWAGISLSGYVVGSGIDVFVNFGDGTIDTSVATVNTGGGGTQYANSSLFHTYTGSGTYIIQTIVVAPDGKSDTLLSSPIDVFACGNLSGKVYMDQNSDCIFNTGEQVFINSSVKVTDPATGLIYYANTDVNGDYEVKVPIGPLYDVTMWSPSFPISCPVGGHTGVTVPTSGIDLGMTCPAGFDLFGNVWGAGFRPGFPRFFTAIPYNAACIPTNGTIKVVLSDPKITYSPSAFITNPPVVNGDTISWSFSGLTFQNAFGSFGGITFPFYVLTDTSAHVNDTICLEVIVEPTAGDLDPTNNVQTICFPVRNSFDPNEKNAQPLGFGEDHIVAPETNLEYTIHFQNTGNDVAYDVFILDELDENLDLSTVQIQGASHPVKMDVLENNTLRFSFDNINLPDSTSNEAESHGLVSFTVDHKTDVALGTKIDNQVGIYFDFNPPIITNTVTRTIDIVSGIAQLPGQGNLVSFYPNPANEKITIQLNSIDQADLIVHTITGQVMVSKTIKSGGETLDVSGLPSGVYLMEVRSNTNRQVERLLIH